MESSSRKGGEELSTYKKWLKLMDIKKKNWQTLIK